MAASSLARPPQEGEDVIDAGGAYALPGLVDIHFHGAVGHDFCDADEAGLQAIADFEASKGVLAICPATMTFSEEILNGIMDVAAAHKNERGADLVGINMEGPYISPKKVGAQNPKYVMAADAGMFRRLQARSGGLIKLVDVAPEEPGNLDFIKECRDEVRISIAHTCTDYDTAKAAFAAGASHMTHLYNAMPGITHREPGPIIAAPGCCGPHPARRRKASLCGAGCQRPFHPCFAGAGRQTEQALCAGCPDGGLCPPEPHCGVGGALAAHGHSMAAGAGRCAVLRKPCAQCGPCGPLHRVAHRESPWQQGRLCAPVLTDAPLRWNI